MNGVPAYAGVVSNPMMLLAIESSRRYLLQDDAIRERWDRALAKMPPPQLTEEPRKVDTPSLLKRWEGDPRAAVLQFEALTGLMWKELPPPGGKPECGGAAIYLAGHEANPLVAIRRPSAEVLREQARLVADSAADRMKPKSEEPSQRDRICEIAVQVVPQFAFWSSVLPMHPERMTRTIELMQLALALAFTVEQRFKHALAVPRPHEVKPSICPALLTPGHGSLPSGHATEAFTTATVLAALLDLNGTTSAPLRRLAQRIADNRQVAGLHYPIDTKAGQLLGFVLGDYLVARCRDGEVRTGSFNGDRLEGDETCQEGGDDPRDKREGWTNVIEPGQQMLRVEHSDQLRWLWDEARQEWGAKPLAT
jgi:hypothetical protein